MLYVKIFLFHFFPAIKLIFSFDLCNADMIITVPARPAFILCYQVFFMILPIPDRLLGLPIRLSYPDTITSSGLYPEESTLFFC